MLYPSSCSQATTRSRSGHQVLHTFHHLIFMFYGGDSGGLCHGGNGKGCGAHPQILDQLRMRYRVPHAKPRKSLCSREGSEHDHVRVFTVQAQTVQRRIFPSGTGDTVQNSKYASSSTTTI